MSLYSDLVSAEPSEYSSLDARSEGHGYEEEGEGSWYTNWVFWLYLSISVVFLFYLVYMHSLDQKVRIEHNQKYALNGRNAHLNTIMTLPRGHLEKNEELQLPNSVVFSA